MWTRKMPGFRSLCFFFLCFTSYSEALRIKSADRTIDLTSQLCRISATLTIENDGSKPVSSFLYFIEPSQKGNLAFISGNTGKDIKATTSSDGPLGAAAYEVRLKEELPAGKTTKVKIEAVFAQDIVPFPKEILQKEKHLVKYTGNLYVYSAYQVGSQTTKVNLASSSIESYTKTKPVSQAESTITYGPYENIKPFTEEELAVHYENSKPFLTVTSLLRTIELSHWGNLAVEETVDILHTGAKLKGSFSRFEFQRENANANVVKKFKTLLPAAAADIYYRDDIGNISTSNVRVMKDSVEAELRPRFPLFGGWRTHYVLGYNIPAYEYLYRNGDSYTLKARLLDHVFDNVFVQNLEVRVILPEGCSNIRVKTPYETTRGEDKLHYTFLDTQGRPVITLYAKNLVDEHIQDFEVHYEFNRLFMLREPFMCIVAFFLLYVALIIYARLDFSLVKDEATIGKLKAAGIAEEVKNQHEKREGLYKQWVDLITKVKLTKDVTSFQNSLKSLLSDIKEQNKVIGDLATQMKSNNPALAEKVSEVQKHESVIRDIMTSKSTNAERVVQGKLPKNQYAEQESTLDSKQSVETDKINSLLRSLGN